MRVDQISALPRTLLSLLRVDASLRQRAAVGALLSVAELGISQVLRLASNLIMTRLLLPEAFGLMAMVSTLHVGLTLLTDISVHLSIVQSKSGETPRFLRVAWVVQIIRGLSIAAVTVLAALLLWLLGPHVAPAGSIYADAALPGLIALSSAILIIKGFESTNQFLAARRLHYRQLAVVNLASQFVTLVAMVVLARVDASVWALLVGTILGGVFRLFLSHVIFDGPRMAVVWDRGIAHELWRFGRWLFISSTITFFAGFADRVIFGALLDAGTFSYYTIASLWVDAAAALGVLLIDRVGFPSLAETFRDRPEKLAEVFRRLLIAVDATAIALFCAAAFVLPGIIGILYSDLYAKSSLFIPILAISILGIRYSLFSMLILAVGDSKTTMLVSLVTAIFVCVGLPIAYGTLGLMGGLLIMSLKSLAAAPILIANRRRILGDRAGVDLAWIGSILCIVLITYVTYRV